MKGMSDVELYLQLRNGSEDACRTLYERYAGKLYGFIYRFTANQELAEEILHDIFAELLAGKMRIEGEGALKGWLYTVAKNKSLNHLKKTSREVIDLNSIEEAGSESGLESESASENLLRVLSAAEKSLPKDLYQTWDLRKRGMDYQQIASALAIPVGTVKSRFHRIVRLLRKEFDYREL